jgi:hypothetical protein
LRCEKTQFKVAPAEKTCSILPKSRMLIAAKIGRGRDRVGISANGQFRILHNSERRHRAALLASADYLMAPIANYFWRFCFWIAFSLSLVAGPAACEGNLVAHPARRKAAAASSALRSIFLAACILTICRFPLASSCELPGRIVSSTLDANRKMNEFRVILQSPDLTNISAVTQHLTSATVLTRILIAEVASRSRGQCSIIASTSLFPDLRIGVQYDSSTADTDRCSGLVTDILAGFTPSQESVEKIASSIDGAKRFSASHPGGPMTEASNALNAALKYIYEKDSVMHALVSVDSSEFESTSSVSFIKWLGTQRSSDGMVLTPLVMCKSDEEISNANRADRTLPYSNIIAPQAISLPFREDEASPSRLHYVVLVGGDFQPENAVLRSAATKKYCRQKNTYPSGPADSSFVAQTRCLNEIIHNADTWVALFCDPKDCSSAELAKSVATTIANDPDIAALGRAFAQHAQPRGPYLVKLIGSDK